MIFDHHDPEVLASECIFFCFAKKSRELQNPGDGFLILLIRQGKPSIPGHRPPLSGDSAIAERSQQVRKYLLWSLVSIWGFEVSGRERVEAVAPLNNLVFKVKLLNSAEPGTC